MWFSIFILALCFGVRHAFVVVGLLSVCRCWFNVGVGCWFVVVVFAVWLLDVWFLIVVLGFMVLGLCVLGVGVCLLGVWFLFSF